MGNCENGCNQDEKDAHLSVNVKNQKSLKKCIEFRRHGKIPKKRFRSQK